MSVRARDRQATTGARATGGTDRPCLATRGDGLQVPCTSNLGWFSPEYDCYLRFVGATPSGRAEHPGMDFYLCDPGPLGWVVGGPTDNTLWLPLGTVGVDPEVLAQEAVSSMGLTGVTIGLAPPAGAVGLVNAPVWLWAADTGPTTWGPVSATASAGTVSVTATARATALAWDMGDGTTVACDRGVAYAPGMDPTAPPCGHVYRRSGQWPVTVTTSWSVDWVATTGGTGSQTVETTSQTTLSISEARARIIGRG